MHIEEQIKPGYPGSGIDPVNWQSAASDAGYQTPAEPNSQSENKHKACNINISPGTITPDGDGMDDELEIHYTMNSTGYMARIMVFDKTGRKIRTIANGKLLGTEGFYTFNGKDSAGGALPSGYYILYFDAYDDIGRRITEKISFVIAGNRE